MNTNVPNGPDRVPYGIWPGPLDPRRLYELPAEPGHPFQVAERLFWIQSLPDQGGRMVVMEQRGNGGYCLTPGPFSLRTRVHEYGGRCFCVQGDTLVFNNLDDGRLYVQSLKLADDGAVPRPLTPESSSVVGFADLVSVGDYVVAVMEEKVPGLENANSIVAVPLQAVPMAPITLVQGSDFYASPVVDPAGRSLAWLEWNHPDMPWDRSGLMRARLNLADGPSVGKPETVVDGAETTVYQPGFLDDGSLVFAMDSAKADWSNLYRWASGKFHQLTDEAGEFGEPHWVFGQRRWCQVAKNQLVAICSNHTGDRLMRVDISDGSEPMECLRSAALAHLCHGEIGVVLVASAEDRPPHLLRLDCETGDVETVGHSPGPLLDSGFSAPQTIRFGTNGDESAWAYYYPPFHPCCIGPEGELPPLIVMVHGGPTSRSTPAFHPLRQYFSYLGFAVVDVNHRGSTGYGRGYRQRLLGEWGVVDVADIIACIDALAVQKLINPEAVFIRGGSAGGYSVLRALTRYPDRFAGGACYYGIGNLVTLAKITHKFESRYTDRLVGEEFDPESASKPQSPYRVRSPINDIDRLVSPLILFQGLDDKIVPPAVSREVAAQLADRGIRHAYHEYAGEGHGFRLTATRVDALEKETDFFRKVLADLPRQAVD